MPAEHPGVGREEAPRERITDTAASAGSGARLRPSFAEILLDALPGFVYLYDVRSQTNLYCNAGAEALLGYTPAQVRALGPAMLATLIPEPDLGRAKARFQRLAEGGCPEVIEYRVRRANGEIRWLRSHEVVLEQNRGSGAVLVLGFAEDITQEKADAERGRLLQQLVDTARQSIFAADIHRTLILWNPAAEALFGYSAEEALGRDVLDLIPLSKDRTEAAAILNEVTGGRPWTGEFLAHPRTGRELWLRMAGFPIYGADGQITGLVGISEDITSEVKAREQTQCLQARLEQAQRLESLGRLAGGIAHDFNNLLTVINGCASMALGATDDPATVQLNVEQILDTGQRAARLTQQLLAFSRRQWIHPRVVDVNEMIRRSEGMLRRLAGGNMDLCITAASRDACTLADEAQLTQVLVNLVTNAREAQPGGGWIGIETAVATVDAETAQPMAAGDYVVLSVSDRGRGIDPDTRAHLFEPFFTTKAGRQSTGLGLATVYGIVQQHNGWVSVESDAGPGAVFRVFLPRCEQPPQPADEPAPCGVLSGSETVLVAEDHPEVRGFVSRALREFGYRVLEAANVAEALERFERAPAPVRLLVTDLLMPDGNGRQLAAAVRQRNPALAVLFITGYMLDPAGVPESDSEHVLAKPFTSVELARKVREILDARC